MIGQTYEYELDTLDSITNECWKYDKDKSIKHGKPILVTTITKLEEYGPWGPWWEDLPKNCTFWYGDNKLSLVTCITHKDKSPSQEKVGLCVFNK